ncbi:MAG: HypC/HybG/HupF family hydrogenase formation chaperone [Thermoguttaceae bacterium]|jgi:hydrogenase expression/formation protein HypC|nr:HypC/HybG/HupF family hydrogenase formation chaperone [Thermoguttaceae bacterium]
MCLGIPGKIVETFQRDELPMAKVEFGGIVKDICLAYTPDAGPGQYVLVHVGFAINQIDETEAQEIFQYIEEIEKAGTEGDDDPAEEDST